MHVREAPPGPPSGWLGTSLTRQFASDPLAFSLQMVREYGPIVSLRFGSQQTYLVAEPEVVHEVLVTNNRLFRKEHRTDSNGQLCEGYCRAHPTDDKRLAPGQRNRCPLPDEQPDIENDLPGDVPSGTDGVKLRSWQNKLKCLQLLWYGN